MYTCYFISGGVIIVQCVVSLSVADESAFRFFLVVLCLGLVIMFGVVSGELNGLFWVGLPFGGVVSGISVSSVGSALKGILHHSHPARSRSSTHNRSFLHSPTYRAEASAHF